jgi:DNA (cytosine-5)-methyltransferase 1
LCQRQNDGILSPFPIWDDVRSFDGTRWRGSVDVVSGGFPCQDISVAGAQAGIHATRSGLWKEFKRIIGDVRPGLVFIENSPNLALLGLNVVIEDLASLGYVGSHGVLGGGAVGSVCEGERMWIVAAAANCAMLESVDVPEYIKPYSEESRRRQYSGAIGSMLRQDDYTIVKRDTYAVAGAMDQLKAIGNGQNPFLAALAWRVLRQRIGPKK